MKPIVSLSVVAGIALASTAGAQAPSDISPTPGRWAVTYAPTHEAGSPAGASASNGAKAMNGITVAVTALNAGGAPSPATNQQPSGQGVTWSVRSVRVPSTVTAARWVTSPTCRPLRTDQCPASTRSAPVRTTVPAPEG